MVINVNALKKELEGVMKVNGKSIDRGNPLYTFADMLNPNGDPQAIYSVVKGRAEEGGIAASPEGRNMLETYRKHLGLDKYGLLKNDSNLITTKQGKKITIYNI